MISWDPWIKKRFIYLSCILYRGLQRHLLNYTHLTRYFCFSSIKSLSRSWGMNNEIEKSDFCTRSNFYFFLLYPSDLLEGLRKILGKYFFCCLPESLNTNIYIFLFLENNLCEFSTRTYKFNRCTISICICLGR